MQTSAISRNVIATFIAMATIAISVTFAHAEQGVTASTDGTVVKFAEQKTKFLSIVDQCGRTPMTSVGAPVSETTKALATSLQENKKQLQEAFTQAKQSYDQAKQEYKAKVVASGTSTVTVNTAGARFMADRDALFTEGCAQISATSSTQTPAAYGAPFNVLSGKREQLIKTRCTGNSNDVTIDVGDGSKTQYIYDTGYVWKNNQWTPFTLDAGTSTHTGGWIVGSAASDVVVANATGTNYIVSYVCTWQAASTASGTGTWKCGCKDAACNVPSWQLQIVKAKEQPIAPACMIEQPKPEEPTPGEKTNM